MDQVKEETEFKITFIAYQNGRAKVVSQEEWEQSWLEWWQRKGQTEKQTFNYFK